MRDSSWFPERPPRWQRWGTSRLPPAPVDSHVEGACWGADAAFLPGVEPEKQSVVCEMNVSLKRTRVTPDGSRTVCRGAGFVLRLPRVKVDKCDLWGWGLVFPQWDGVVPCPSFPVSGKWGASFARLRASPQALSTSFDASLTSRWASCRQARWFSFLIAQSRSEPRPRPPRALCCVCRVGVSRGV